MAWIRAGAGGQSDCPVSVDFPTTTMPQLWTGKSKPQHNLNIYPCEAD